MNDNLRSLLILFLSICQIYVFRITRDFLTIFGNYEALEYVRPIFHLCKTIMIFGICFSISKRLQSSATSNSTNIQAINTSTIDIRSPSFLSTDEENVFEEMQLESKLTSESSMLLRTTESSIYNENINSNSSRSSPQENR